MFYFVNCETQYIFAVLFHKGNTKYIKMSIPQSGNTQAERLSQQLMIIKTDVTAQDRLDAIKELGYSKPTISRYLNGYVLDNDTAATLLVFFRARISEREKSLTANETATI